MYLGLIRHFMQHHRLHSQHNLNTIHNHIELKHNLNNIHNNYIHLQHHKLTKKINALLFFEEAKLKNQCTPYLGILSKTLSARYETWTHCVNWTTFTATLNLNIIPTTFTTSTFICNIIIYTCNLPKFQFQNKP